MDAPSLSAAFVASYKHNGWRTGVMFWQYSSDPNGTICLGAMSALMNLANTTVNVNVTTNTTNATNTTNTTNTTNSSIPQISYPIRFAYVNKIDWSSTLATARSLGVPGYAPPHIYNYICLCFWTASRGPLDVALAWN